MAGRRQLGRTIATAAAGLLLAGACSMHRAARPAAAPSEAVDLCARLYREVDAAVTAAGVRDAQAAPVPGFPYLRLNRFLAALPVDPTDPGFDAWVDRMRALDREARRAELANLPAAAGEPDWDDRLEGCANVLRSHDLADPTSRARLTAAKVPDDYRLGLRILGLYPLTSLPFLLGVRNLHADIEDTFATPLDALPVQGTLRRFGPAPATVLRRREVADLLAQAAADPLAVPEPAQGDLRRLLASFAPVWEIDVASAADQPGRPTLQPTGRPRVDGEPVVYTLTSHTFWQGRSLLQVNYVLWFPERPRTGRFDLVGGRMDGITLRVTLDTDGRPLLYESMHNCGCYYKAYPSPRLTVQRRRHGWQEPMSIPQRVDDGAGRLVVRVGAGNHYVQRLYHDVDASLDAGYTLADYHGLRSLPLPDGGRRSLFRPDGMVTGTERGERWLFWPMGVPEPGAMRQWGNHAIAFVGRRHFDDPRLLERHFAPR